MTSADETGTAVLLVSALTVSFDFSTRCDASAVVSGLSLIGTRALVAVWGALALCSTHPLVSGAF